MGSTRVRADRRLTRVAGVQDGVPLPLARCPQPGRGPGVVIDQKDRFSGFDDGAAMRLLSEVPGSLPRVSALSSQWFPRLALRSRWVPFLTCNEAIDSSRRRCPPKCLDRSARFTGTPEIESCLDKKSTSESRRRVLRACSFSGDSLTHRSGILRQESGHLLLACCRPVRFSDIYIASRTSVATGPKLRAHQVAVSWPAH